MNHSYLHFSDMTPGLQIVLFVAILCGSVGGIVVASILKLLDNIVKVSVIQDKFSSSNEIHALNHSEMC